MQPLTRLLSPWCVAWGLTLCMSACFSSAFAHEPLSIKWFPPPSDIPSSPTILLEVFVDFYCPPCHEFHKHVLPQIKEEFGPALEIQEIAFPVVQGHTREAFELYEAGKAEGQGDPLAAAIFRAVQEEKKSLGNPQVRSMILQEVGLDPQRIDAHIQSGAAARGLEGDIRRGTEYGITFIPVAVLNRTYLLLDTSAQNISRTIRFILAKSGTQK